MAKPPAAPPTIAPISVGSCEDVASGIAGVDDDGAETRAPVVVALTDVAVSVLKDFDDFDKLCEDIAAVAIQSELRLKNGAASDKS